MASRYKARRNRSMWFIEMLLGAYCLANFAIYLTVDHMVFSLFLGIYAVGYLAIGWMSRPEANLPRRVVVLTEPDPDVPAVLTPASSPVLTG
jgi:hypothetical protein